MKNIVEAEILKLNKNKIYLLIIILNFFSLLYGAGIKFNWCFVSFAGEFDIYRYVFSIWQLYFILGIPMIILMYAGAKILGDEIRRGQIVLEVAPVSDRKKLIKGKFIAMILTTLFYFFTNILFNIIAYFVFVKGTDYAASASLLTKDNFDILIQIIFGLFEIYFLVLLAMFISIDRGAIIGTLGSIVIYVITSLLTRSEGIAKYVIGYFNLKSESEINIETILIQAILYVIFINLVKYISVKKFRQKDL